MGIYIKGMEMPKGCKDCGLKVNCDECEGWECVCMPLHTTIGYYDDLLSDKRREDCPLVPVPQHGDLIDRNDLTICDYDIDGGSDSFGYFSFKAVPEETLNDATVIIPASDD